MAAGQRHRLGGHTQGAKRIACSSILLACSSRWVACSSRLLACSSRLLLTATLKAAAQRVLLSHFRLGFFDVQSPSFPFGNDTLDWSLLDSQKHRDLAAEAAAKSTVLLKNKAKALPLQNSGSIAVVGPWANCFQVRTPTTQRPLLATQRSDRPLGQLLPAAGQRHPPVPRPRRLRRAVLPALVQRLPDVHDADCRRDSEALRRRKSELLAGQQRHLPEGRRLHSRGGVLEPTGEGHIRIPDVSSLRKFLLFIPRYPRSRRTTTRASRRRPSRRRSRPRPQPT